MKNLMKKIVVSIVGLSMVVMMVPGIAQGVTAEELQAQIASLTAQLTALQAQLTALTGAPAAAACTFTRALYPGVSGADVKCLQQYLNGAGYALAVSGVGSAGNETQYYGPLTQAAVKKWQDANGVVYGAYGGYFGPISQAKYTALAAAAPAEEEEEEEEVLEGGAEGGILATINSTPASGLEVYVSTTGKAIGAVDVKAIGDVVVNRLDLNFSKRPWLYVSGVTVTDGTTTKSIAVTEAGTSEVTVGSSYLFRIDGLNISIPKDTTKTLTVKVDTVSALPGTETSTDVILTFKADSIRATDGVGLAQYAPTGDLATRTFTVKEGDTANLEITANVDNPKARNVIIQSTAETTGVVLAKINVKATNRDAILRKLRFADTAASGTLNVVYLYDGDTLLSSTSSIVTATSTIADINLTIPKDTTKVLTLKADINKASGNYAPGVSASTTLTVEANTGTTYGGLEAEDATTFAAATVSGSTVAPETSYFYTKAPQLVLVSASLLPVSVATSTLTYNGKADARIKINLTANGGDIYVASSTANDVTATTTIAASATIVESISTAATDSSGGNWVVYSGETKQFEIYGQVTGANETATDLATYVYLTNLKWDDADSGASASYENQTWGLTDFKTGSTVLEYIR